MGPYTCASCQKRTLNDSHLCDGCSCPLCGEESPHGKAHDECSRREMDLIEANDMQRDQLLYNPMSHHFKPETEE